jgi:hypothetical protein
MMILRIRPSPYCFVRKLPFSVSFPYCLLVMNLGEHRRFCSYPEWSRWAQASFILSCLLRSCMDLIFIHIRIVLDRTSSSLFATILLLFLWIASSSVFLALLLSFDLWKQIGIGRAPLALIQVVRTTQDRFECQPFCLTLIQASKDLGLRAQASFQLCCSHPVVKTTRDRSSTTSSHPGHENNPG